MISRRGFLIAQACMRGADIWLASEAVATTAMEHPEWDMDDTKTWSEWEAML